MHIFLLEVDWQVDKSIDNHLGDKISTKLNKSVDGTPSKSIILSATDSTPGTWSQSGRLVMNSRTIAFDEQWTTAVVARGKLATCMESKKATIF